MGKQSLTASEKSDPDLIASTLEGDLAAFDQLVDRHFDMVYFVAFARLRSRESAEDLAQEAFIVAWQKLAELKDAASFKAWICTIVRNLANRTLQRQSRRVTTDLDAIPEVATDSESPVEHAASAEEVDRPALGA